MKKVLAWTVATLGLLAIVGWTVIESVPTGYAFLDGQTPLSATRAEGALFDLPDIGFKAVGTSETLVYRLHGSASDLLDRVRRELCREDGWREDQSIQRTAIWFTRRSGSHMNVVVVSRRDPAVTVMTSRPESIWERIRGRLGG